MKVFETHKVVQKIGFPGGLVINNSPTLQEMQETQVWSFSWEDTLEEEMAIPLQYSCLENSMDRGAWRAIVHGVAKSWTHDWATNALWNIAGYT